MQTKQERRELKAAQEADRDFVWENIERHLERVDDAYVEKSLFSNIRGLNWRIARFKDATELYDNNSKRWTGIPSADSNDVDSKEYRNQLRTAIYDIARTVLAEVCVEEQQAVRSVVDSHKIPFAHSKEHDTTGRCPTSSPDIVIHAQESGSFEAPSSGSFAYTNITTAFHVESNFYASDGYLALLQHAREAGVYARQIMVQQPNRKYVRVLFFSERHFRLLHFDHAGCQYSSVFDVHEKADLLIRLIVGLTSLDEEDLGLDTTIKFTVEGGKKVGGTIEASNGEKIVRYPLTSVKPRFISGYLVGPGTALWDVKDPKTGEPLVIRTAWKKWGDRPLNVPLELAKGVAGVVQTISCETLQDAVHKYRGTRSKKQDSRYPPQEHLYVSSRTRVVMERYGSRVSRIIGEEHVISIFRDAIYGHGNYLLQKGMLHRDVARGNILHKPSGDRGRGVLIDLEQATPYEELKSGDIDYTTGTKPYMSISVMHRRIYGDKGTLFHDHMDDLESFLYVLCEIVFERVYFTHEEVGLTFNIEKPKFLAQWENGDNWEVVASKLRFLDEQEQINLEGIDSYWSPPTRKLLKSFFIFIKKNWSRKEKFHKTGNADAAHKAFCNEAEQHYAEVLGMFDAALKELGVPTHDLTLPKPKPPLDVTKTQRNTSKGQTKKKATTAKKPQATGTKRKHRVDEQEASQAGRPRRRADARSGTARKTAAPQPKQDSLPAKRARRSKA